MKRLILVVFFVALAVLNFAIYWNIHLYYMATASTDIEEKIGILEDANRYFPWNDLVYYELGKAYYALGIQNFNSGKMDVSLFQLSVSKYHRSILLNPASQYCHFNLAQSLFYLDVGSLSLNVRAGEELKKAVLLVDHNSEIFFEVGKLFLGRWDELSEEDKVFACDTLRKILESLNKEKIRSIFHAWDINIGDYEILEKFLPRNLAVYNRLAEFLGERSIYLEKRQELLSEGELLEIEEAQRDLQRGEEEFYHFNLEEATQYFKHCLRRLERINFYQDLTQQYLIDFADYFQLKKSAYLNLAKCAIEKSRNLSEAKQYLEIYLDQEENVQAINDLESFLVEQGIFNKKVGVEFDDLDKLALHIHLLYKQNRYGEIIRIGRLIQTYYVVIPEGVKSEFVKILQIVGDAFHKTDNLYDATEYYKRALEIDPENLGSLQRLKINNERLNNMTVVQKISQDIEKILYPKNMIYKTSLIEKGHRSSRRMLFDGREIIMRLYFENNLRDAPPLVTILFNGHVVWEDYLKNNVLSLQLETKNGTNILQVVAVNKDLFHNRMQYEFLDNT